MTNPDVWTPGVAIGSTDWAGGTASPPAASQQGGPCTITDFDGTTRTFWVSVNEAKARIRDARDRGGVASFPIPGTSRQQALYVSNIAHVS